MSFALFSYLMKLRCLPLVLLCAFLVACDFGDKSSADQHDVDNPTLWVTRIFGRIENGITTPPIPLPGESLSAIVTTPRDGQSLSIHVKNGATIVPTSITPSPIIGASIVTWKIPDSLEPGWYEIRFASDTESSSWIEIAVTTPALLAERQTISAIAAALPEADRPGVKLLMDYEPLPAGLSIVDGATGEHTYGPTAEGEWLVYGVNPDAGLAQDEAFWAVGNPVQGLTVVANPLGPIGPIKPIGWPEGRDTTNTYFAIRDFSIPINQSSQFFDAAQEGDEGNPLDDGPAPEEEPPTPPPVLAPPPPPTGYGLTGDLGPCPNGIKTVGVVIQFDDNTGFDWLLQKTADLLTQLGATETALIPTERFANDSHRYNPASLASQLRDLAAGLDCECDEVVISIICHGVVDRDGKHFLVFKDRYLERGTLRARPERVETADLMKLIAKAFHDAGKDCVPVTVLLQPCYSGAALDEIPDSVEEGADGPRDHFRVIAAAAADQTANGDWDGDEGKPDIYFLEALLDCLEDQQFDFNGDGFVTLQEAWICMLEQVWLHSMSQSGKPQNPKKWPNP